MFVWTTTQTTPTWRPSTVRFESFIGVEDLVAWMRTPS